MSNALLFGVEIPAILIRTSAQKDWIEFYNGLINLHNQE